MDKKKDFRQQFGGRSGWIYDGVESGAWNSPAPLGHANFPRCARERALIMRPPASVWVVITGSWVEMLLFLIKPSTFFGFSLSRYPDRNLVYLGGL